MQLNLIEVLEILSRKYYIVLYSTVYIRLGIIDLHFLYNLFVESISYLVLCVLIFKKEV